MNLLKTHWYTISISLLFAVGVFFCLFKLIESPPVWYDEGFYVQASANLAEKGISGMTISPDKVEKVSFITVGYSLIYPLALVFKIFGVGILQARLLMVIFILAFLAVSYVFVKKNYSQDPTMSLVPLWVLLLLVTFPPLYANGKSVLGEVPGLFYFVLSLLFLTRTIEGKPKRNYLYFALFAGLAVITKPLYLTLIPALGLPALIFWKKWISHWRYGLLVLAAFVAPIVVWLGIQFSKSDSVSSVFGFYANPYGFQDVFGKILANIKLMFVSPGPLLLLVVLAIWSVSILYRLKLKPTPTALQPMEWISVLFALIMTVAFLRTNGSFRYLFPAQIVSLLYFPQAVIICAELVSRRGTFFESKKKYVLGAAYTFLALIVVLGTYQLLFDSWVADSYRSHKTVFWQEYFAGQDPRKLFFFYDAPEVAILNQTTGYYQYIIPAGVTIGAENLKALKAGVPDIVIIETAVLVSHPKDDTFKMYTLDREAYKYSILKKKK